MMKEGTGNGGTNLASQGFATSLGRSIDKRSFPSWLEHRKSAGAKGATHRLWPTGRGAVLSH